MIWLDIPYPLFFLLHKQLTNKKQTAPKKLIVTEYLCYSKLQLVNKQYFSKLRYQSVSIQRNKCKDVISSMLQASLYLMPKFKYRQVVGIRWCLYDRNTFKLFYYSKQFVPIEAILTCLTKC